MSSDELDNVARLFMQRVLVSVRAVCREHLCSEFGPPSRRREA